jgi:hypothetical protein
MNVSDEVNFPKKDAEIDLTSWNTASLLLDQLFFSECFRPVQLTEEGCRD